MVMRYRRTPLGVLVNIFEGLGDFDIDRPLPNLYVLKKKSKQFFLKIGAVQEKNCLHEGKK